MSKSGQARVLTDNQLQHLFDCIANHRHPEKNKAIMMISFRLGLRAQEIALLQIKEVATLLGQSQFRLNEIMALPAAYTKGANATTSDYVRKSLTLTTSEFERVIRDVSRLVAAGVDPDDINPEDYYPELKQHKGVSRDLPMVDEALRESLETYLAIRLDKEPSLKPTDPLFLSQKGSPYSASSLQQHMGKMLKKWAGIEKASSHSGRRTLLTNVIQGQGKSLKIAQSIAGHKQASTTAIYEEPTEEHISTALEDAYKR